MEQLIQLAGGFGAPGLLLAFMVYQQRDRREVDLKRIEADIELAKQYSIQSERILQLINLLQQRVGQ